MNKIFYISPSSCIEGVYELYDSDKQAIAVSDFNGLLERIIDSSNTEVDVRYLRDYYSDWSESIVYYNFREINSYILDRLEKLYISRDNLSNRYIKFLIDNGTLIRV